MRDQLGETVTYNPAENVHRDGILHTTTVPSAISEPTRAAAIAQTKTLMQVLEYVGTIGVEFFVTGTGHCRTPYAAPMWAWRTLLVPMWTARKRSPHSQVWGYIFTENLKPGRIVKWVTSTE